MEMSASLRLSQQPLLPPTLGLKTQLKHTSGKTRLSVVRSFWGEIYSSATDAWNLINVLWLEYLLKSQSVFTSFYYTSAVKVKSVKSMAARLGLGIDLWRGQVLFSLRHRLWTNSVSQPLDNADSSTAETSPGDSIQCPVLERLE